MKYTNRLGWCGVCGEQRARLRADRTLWPPLLFALLLWASPAFASPKHFRAAEHSGETRVATSSTPATCTPESAPGSGGQSSGGVSCPPCGPLYCKNKAAADQEREAKKASMRASGFPERLLSLLDQYQCVACIRFAPDSFTIMIEYEPGTGPSSGGQTWTSVSYRWSAQEEALARKELREGKIKAFYIMNSRTACRCCDDPDPRTRSDWNPVLEMNTSGMLSYASPQDLGPDPPDLKKVPPELLQELPPIGVYTKPPLPQAHASCPACNAAAEKFNSIASTLDYLWSQKINLQKGMDITHRAMVERENQIAAIEYAQNLNPQAGAQNQIDGLEKINAAQAQGLQSDQRKLDDLDNQIAQQNAQLNAAKANLLQCEQTRCQSPGAVTPPAPPTPAIPSPAPNPNACPPGQICGSSPGTCTGPACTSTPATSCTGPNCTSSPTGTCNPSTDGSCTSSIPSGNCQSGKGCTSSTPTACVPAAGQSCTPPTNSVPGGNPAGGVNQVTTTTTTTVAKDTQFSPASYAPQLTNPDSNQNATDSGVAQGGGTQQGDTAQTRSPGTPPPQPDGNAASEVSTQDIQNAYTQSGFAPKGDLVFKLYWGFVEENHYETVTIPAEARCDECRALEQQVLLLQAVADQMRANYLANMPGPGRPPTDPNYFWNFESARQKFENALREYAKCLGACRDRQYALRFEQLQRQLLHEELERGERIMREHQLSSRPTAGGNPPPFSPAGYAPELTSPDNGDGGGAKTGGGATQGGGTQQGGTTTPTNTGKTTYEGGAATGGGLFGGAPPGKPCPCPGCEKEWNQLQFVEGELERLSTQGPSPQYSYYKDLLPIAQNAYQYCATGCGGPPPAAPPTNYTPHIGGPSPSGSSILSGSGFLSPTGVLPVTNAILTSNILYGSTPVAPLEQNITISNPVSFIPGRGSLAPSTFPEKQEGAWPVDFLADEPEGRLQFAVWHPGGYALASARYVISPLEEEPAEEPKGGIVYSIVANGKSSGEALELQAMDPSGKLQQVELLEGAILEPLKRGTPNPVPMQAPPGGKRITQQLTAYCVDRAKLPPQPGQLYRLAPPSVQAKYQGVSSVLRAGRELAARGTLHPDSDPKQYADAIQQYSLWARLENWDQQKFTEMFLEHTKKNAQAMGAQWTQQMDQAVRTLAPGRWQDISQVLEQAKKLP